VIGAVALGGALGALLRFGVSMAVLALFAEWAVIGTLIANMAGSFLIGLIAARAVRLGISPERDAFLVTGFCGGFTTFSAFSLETVMMIVGGDWTGAGLYVLVSVPAWLGAAWAGWTVGTRLAGR